MIFASIFGPIPSLFVIQYDFCFIIMVKISIQKVALLVFGAEGLYYYSVHVMCTAAFNCDY